MPESIRIKPYTEDRYITRNIGDTVPTFSGFSARYHVPVPYHPQPVQPDPLARWGASDHRYVLAKRSAARQKLQTAK